MQLLRTHDVVPLGMDAMHVPKTEPLIAGR